MAYAERVNLAIDHLARWRVKTMNVVLRAPARPPRLRASSAVNAIIPGGCATMCYMASRQRGSSSVGVRELRQNLSVYLDRVKKGEALTVTERGAAVAILRPIPPAASALERLVAEGRAAPPSRPLGRLPRPLAVMLERPLADFLDELRRERF